MTKVLGQLAINRHYAQTPSMSDIAWLRQLLPSSPSLGQIQAQGDFPCRLSVLSVAWGRMVRIECMRCLGRGRAFLRDRRGPRKATKSIKNTTQR